MLDSIEISAFQIIPYLKVNLSDAHVHMFCGDNEAGKSTLAESVRFALRGLSPRVRLKGDLQKLLHAGKNRGHIEISMDGFPIRRNIRDAKLATKATLDYPDLLVDIQLGAIEFAATDEKALRSMLNTMFRVGTPEEFIRARLGAKGVTEEMMNRTLPLVRVSGFEGAATTATDEHSRAKGRWESITNERYGSKKVLDWQPDILGQPAVSEADIAALREQLTGMNTRRDALNREIGAAAATIKLQQAAGDEDIETLTERVRTATATYAQADSELQEIQESFRSSAADVEGQIRQLERQLAAAKSAATQLKCPCCGAALTMTAPEGIPTLVQGEQSTETTQSVVTVTASLDETRKVQKALLQDQRRAITEQQAVVTEANLQLSSAQAALERRTEMDSKPKVSQEDVDALAGEIASLDELIEGVKANLHAKAEHNAALERAAEVKADAASAAEIAGQWATIAEALGNGPNGIPAELVAATTKPINTAMAKLALTWGIQPCVMGSDLSFARADGMPYFLMSKSAQWRANAMMQLALATQSPLKLVILDGWDIIQPSDRGAFVAMLEDFIEQYPDITVLAMATLKSKPMEAIPGMKFHWLNNGQLQEAA